MKTPFFHILILFTIVGSLFFFQLKSSFYVVIYSVNTEAYIEKYCVNKENPELQCMAKCHLDKHMASEDKNEYLFNILDFDIHFFSTVIYNLEKKYTNYVSNKPYHYLNLFLYTIFLHIPSPPPKDMV